MRSVIRHILDPEIHLRERLFQLLSTIALAEYLIVTVYNLVIGSSALQVITMFAGMALFVGTVTFTLLSDLSANVFFFRQDVRRSTCRLYFRAGLCISGNREVGKSGRARGLHNRQRYLLSDRLPASGAADKAYCVGRTHRVLSGDPPCCAAPLYALSHSSQRSTRPRTGSSSGRRRRSKIFIRCRSASFPV